MEDLRRRQLVVEPRLDPLRLGLGHGHLHTPGYGAPEVVRWESGVNSLTDAWSLAVIAFQLLTHRHPL